jgi:hypothetical protein
MAKLTELHDHVVPFTWLWDRDDLWPCRHTAVCNRLAVWRTVDVRGPATFRGFYCDVHLPHAKPPEPPAAQCHVCGGPMLLDERGIHPACDTSTDDEDAHAAAVQVLTDVLGCTAMESA